MYNQFCKNLQHFIKINNDKSSINSLRLRIAYELLQLSDVEKYLSSKASHDEYYINTSIFINELNNRKNLHPKLGRFLWELWGYGFDAVKSEHVNIPFIEEKAKLIGLLCSTHYIP